MRNNRPIVILSAILICVIFIAALSGCGGNTAPTIEPGNTAVPTTNPDPASDLKATAQGFIDEMENAGLVSEEDNKIGMSVESITKSGDDYIVRWGSTNPMILNNGENQAYLFTQLHFIDPEDYSNNYQAFTIEDGTINRTFETGDEISYFPIRVKLNPSSDVMYMYFEGATEGAPPELYTVPLFFTILLGEQPELLEPTPRCANGIFNEALNK